MTDQAQEMGASFTGRAEASAPGRLLDRLGLLCFAAAMVGVALIVIVRPIYNWDMIAYVALAEETPAMDGVARHDRAYALVRAAAPAEDWARLIGDNPRRERRFADPSAFDAQLGMYRIKLGYVALARGLGQWVPAVGALRLINLFALALIALAGIWWMRVGRFAQAAFFLVPLLLVGRLTETARFGTPDLLCAALSLAGLALLRRGPLPLAALSFAAATLVRPDAILFPAAYLLVALLTRTERRAAAACFAAALLACGAAMTAGDYPGWWPHLGLSVLGPFEGPGAVPPFSLPSYTTALLNAAAINVADRAWAPLAFLLVGAWLLLRGRAGYRPRQAEAIFLALLLALAGRCLAFPLPEDRLYLPIVIMLAMLVAERWAPRWDSAGSGSRAEAPR